MCGFVGYIGKSKLDVRKATLTIKHRGPDQTRITKNKDWVVGFNRLAIIDLNKRSMQPFIDGDIHVFLNGEIFNYIELIKSEKDFLPKTKSDVEIIPYLYKKYGIKFLNKLNGMFSMVIIDDKEKKTFLVRDRFGEKPLFYIKKKNTTYFSSEIRAIKELLNLNVDKNNIEINFRCGFLPQPLTNYKNLYALEPGCYLEISKKYTKKVIWYNLHLNSNSNNGSNLKLDGKNFLKNIDESLKLRLRSDVKVGLFYSGGLDSNLLFERIKKISNKKINLLYCNLPINYDEDSKKITTDVNLKLKKSKRYQLVTRKPDFNYFNKNIVKIINHHDAILFDTSIIVFYLLSKTAKEKNIKVILTGVGGDELFGGYDWQNQIRRLPSFLALNIFSKRFLFLDKIYEKIFKVKFLKKIKNIIAILRAPLIWHLKSWNNRYGFLLGPEKENIRQKMYNLNKNYFDQIDKNSKMDFFNKFNFLTMKIFGVEQHHKTDISSMFYSVENRAPFYDHNVVSFMLGIRDIEKNKKGYKSLLRKFSENIISRKILNKRKSGPTINLEYYFEKLNKKDIKNFILKNKLYIEKYISKHFYFEVKKMLIKFDKKDIVKVFGIVNFIIWCKINLDGTIKNYNIKLTELMKKKLIC